MLDSIANCITPKEHLHNLKVRKHPSMTYCYNTYFHYDSVPNYLFWYNVSGESHGINNPALGKGIEGSNLPLANAMFQNIRWHYTR